MYEQACVANSMLILYVAGDIFLSTMCLIRSTVTGLCQHRVASQQVHSGWYLALFQSRGKSNPDLSSQTLQMTHHQLFVAHHHLTQQLPLGCAVLATRVQPRIALSEELLHPKVLTIPAQG